jgi:hypothetical protein
MAMFRCTKVLGPREVRPSWRAPSSFTSGMALWTDPNGSAWRRSLTWGYGETTIVHPSTRKGWSCVPAPPPPLAGGLLAVESNGRGTRDSHLSLKHP